MEELGHVPYVLEATDGDETIGLLALALVKSRLFGRFLVGLPYLNYGGIIAEDAVVARCLINRAIELADEFDVRHLELRHTRAFDHPGLTTCVGHKVHMIRALPATSETLWKQLGSSVRNQVRKAQKNGLTVAWGGEEMLSEFYDVFSHNMRDLGTPVYGRALFRAVIRQFPNRAEFCVVRLGAKAVAAGLLVHGWRTTEIPSASSLRAYNITCANMLMYMALLDRGHWSEARIRLILAARRRGHRSANSRNNGAQRLSQPSGSITCGPVTLGTCGPIIRATSD